MTKTDDPLVDDIPFAIPLDEPAQASRDEVVLTPAGARIEVTPEDEAKAAAEPNPQPPAYPQRSEGRYQYHSWGGPCPDTPIPGINGDRWVMAFLGLMLSFFLAVIALCAGVASDKR